MKAGYVSRSVRERIRSLPKSEFNRLAQEAADEVIGTAIAARKCTDTFALRVDDLHNMGELRHDASFRYGDPGRVEVGDTLICRELADGELRHDFCGVFVIEDAPGHPFPVFADWEALNRTLYVLGTGIRYTEESIVGIALASVKVAPLFDMVPHWSER